MRTSKQAVMAALRQLGFRETGRGCGSGHELWEDAAGHRCHPKLRKRDVDGGDLKVLGRQLETHGVISQAEFLRSFRDKS